MASKLLRLTAEDTKQAEIHTIVIERKSFKDLKASMSDMRYREQKSRYMQLPKGTMYYIFENNDPKFAELGRKQYVGAYVHTMVRDRIPVFVTGSMDETCEFIVKIGAALEEFGFDASEGKGCSVKESQIKKKKAIGSEVFVQQLCCMPGISSGKAKSIAAEYPNMTSLLFAVKNGTFAVKGIGKVLFNKIKESLLIPGERKSSDTAVASTPASIVFE